MSSKVKAAVFWISLIFAAVALWLVVSGRHTERKVTYWEFLASLESGRVTGVTILGSTSGAVQALCRLADGSTVRTVLPADYRDALRAIEDNRVNIEIRDASYEPLRLLINMTPFLVLLGFWFFMMRKLPNGPRPRLSG